MLMPGIYQETNRDRGSNTKHSEAVISNGSRIYVPENTAAFIFDQSGIENIITESGGYEYRTGGTDSVFAGNGIGIDLRADRRAVQIRRRAGGEQTHRLRESA